MNGFVIETFILIKYKLELILTIDTSIAWLIKWMHIKPAKYVCNKNVHNYYNRIIHNSCILYTHPLTEVHFPIYISAYICMVPTLLKLAAHALQESYT